MKKPTKKQLRQFIFWVAGEVDTLERQQSDAASTLRKTSRALATKRRKLALVILDARKAGAL